MANIYSYDEIKLNVSCVEYLSRMGIEVDKHGRCRATWRGGDANDSVHVEPTKWFDFVEKKGGSVIDLCARVEFNGDAIRAVQRLGEMFNLQPVRVTKARPKKTRAQILTEQGYKNTFTYDYTDETGKLIYSVMRFEKDTYEPGEKKEFVQRTPEHEGLGLDTPRLPYNLPAVVNSSRVCIVEGEKDVETLRGFGIVATTNSGGASNWSPTMNKWFDGKEIVILPDNDEAGEKHGKIIVSMLKPIAKSVKIIVVSSLPKGDVTDWVQKEGGSGQKLCEMIAAAQEIDAEMSSEVAIAKQANQTEFKNYEEIGSGRNSRKEALTLETLVRECHTRFLGFPKKLGETLFDWDREHKKVMFLTNKESVFSWMALLSHHNVVFESGSQFVSKSEFFEGLILRAVQYSSISNVPHYPSRTDVFYTFGSLPPPDPTHSTFWQLVSKFNPCNETHRTILAAFLCAPIFYEPTADRPLWVIDTEDQQASGKTSLVKLCALLYGSEYISIDVNQLDRDIQQIRRRLVSTDARRKRVAVFDNITKTLSSSNLASLITEGYITGLAPYGRSEETRPNDITYVVTVNNANLSDDIASRSYTVRLAKPKNASSNWYEEVARFIEENRMQILSDIIHMCDNNALANSTVRHSRFGRFDSKILSAVCKSEEEYKRVDAALRAETENANTDVDHGIEFIELFRETMRECAPNDVKTRIALNNATDDDYKSIVNPDEPIFITAADVDWMLSHSDGELQHWKSRQILGLIKNNHVPCFDPSAQRISVKDHLCLNGEPLQRYRGFLYRPSSAAGKISAQVIRRNGASFSVIAIAPFKVNDLQNADAPTARISDNPEKLTVANFVKPIETTRDETTDSEELI